MDRYQYTIHKEHLISRIPGLFPYIEFNENGYSVLHKATDSLMGCYAKMVENMVIPCSLEIDGSEILTKGNEYTYRTLIDNYYEYRDTLADDNEFKMFIETGIGKYRVYDESWYVNRENDDDYDLVPEYIHLATAKRDYVWYVRRKRLCDEYAKMIEEGTHIDCRDQYCCDCDEYERKGGDNMLELLGKLITQAEETAKTYLGYASDVNGMSLNFHLMLTRKEQDLGIMTIYDLTWEAGKTYYMGELVTYENETYICTGETSGKWNEETEKLEFDTDNFVKIKDSYSGQLIDGKNVTTDSEGFYKDTYGTKFKICGDSSTTECVDESDADIALSGISDSKLKSFRRYKDYISVLGELEKPEEGEDWLYYYRIGYVANYRTLTDDNGNIQHMGTDMTSGDDLYAYGDVITDIRVEEVENNTYLRQLIIEYVIGAHLKAEKNYVDEDNQINYKTDDDGVTMYYFKNFTYDDSDLYHGVKYTDTYYFTTDDAIYTDFNLADGTSEFDTYVNTLDDIYSTAKYPFVTSNSTTTREISVNNTTVTVSSIVSEFSATVANDPDYQYNKLIKEDYLNGITYQPTKSVDVNITRGNAAAFERHIKLGEIKTLEDLENYSNGGFYSLQSN